ncbi:DUF1648 domain-containing protein [Staphylococcus felis]|uniref:DUF1648 domain-containing protein n=1 Tax=Staphylococcus felis TaxID=46127 RepID=UPI003967C31C
MKRLNSVIPILWGIAMIALAITYHHIPETIGTHFNFTGQPDAFGSKRELWIIPIVLLIVWFVITVLVKYVPTLEKNMTGKRSKQSASQSKGLVILFVVIQLGVWLLYVSHLYLLLNGHDVIPMGLMLVVIAAVLIAFCYKVWTMFRFN